MNLIVLSLYIFIFDNYSFVKMLKKNQLTLNNSLIYTLINLLFIDRDLLSSEKIVVMANLSFRSYDSNNELSFCNYKKTIKIGFFCKNKFLDLVYFIYSYNF